MVAEPGTRFSYSSYGYDVIGAALERVSGPDFASLMREVVLAPAHMRETTPATAPRAARATFYELEDSVVCASRRRSTSAIACRPAASCRRPTTWPASAGADRGTLVGKETAAMMFRSQRTIGGEETGYGLGFEVQPSRFGPFVGHTGAVAGGTAARLIMKTGTVLALTTNLGTRRPSRRRRRKGDA